jgi:hypothetical protein
LKVFWKRTRTVGVTGNRDFNPGWHTALDLRNLLTVLKHYPRGLGTEGKPWCAVS